MPVTSCLILSALIPVMDQDPPYVGREGQLDVQVPRIEADLAVDGVLDEPVWSQAAVLTGFSQYSPTDGVPASDSTDILVWYSPTAIHFGIRAYEAHGSVHATLADRDRIFGDDNIQILLGTFHDGRQATLFAVNPLGVQGDGAIVESGRSTARGFGLAAPGGREPADLSPDYVFQSKGRLTDFGYEVEVRIPFKSFKYQAAAEQNWGINVVRQVQHSGFEDSWAPAQRASASFLGQSGTLAGLTDLRRGLVLDVNPELTSRVIGQPGSSGWSYDPNNPQVGGNVRWGISNNLTLNGTVKPDFSQVESDAGQLAFDPRQLLFFSEKRPFFLDGLEQFQTPNNLIYTRRIVQPLAAVKLTGKTFGTNVALLTAVDERTGSITGQDHPFYTMVRAQRDVGKNSRLGFAYTDRIDGDAYNRVANVDGRLVFGGVYSAQFQIAGSRTRRNGVTTTAPLWMGRFDRSGHTVGFRALINAVDEDFRASSGFISRPGIVHSYLNPSLTFYGRGGGLLQRFTTDVLLDGIWQYQKFVNGRGIQDQKLHLNGNAVLRGGWDLSAGYFIESFGYDSALFAPYRLEVSDGAGGLDTIPFTGQPTIKNGEYFVQVNTPRFRSLDGFVFWLQGHDENFFEWASADLIFLQAGLNWRPSERLRVGFSYNWQQVNRRTDGSLVNVGRIPRLKLEYQVSRPIFIRVVGQYVQEKTDSLRDDSRTGAPILIQGPGGVVRAAASRNNFLRVDALFSYQPTPGTVIFAGYGSTLTEPEAFRFRGLQRTTDAFFAKLSYLFRL